MPKKYTLETPLCGSFKVRFVGIKGEVNFRFDYMPLGGFAAHAYPAITGEMIDGDVLEIFKIVKVDLKNHRLVFKVTREKDADGK